MLKDIFTNLCVITLVFEYAMIYITYKNEKKNFPKKLYTLCLIMSSLALAGYAFSINCVHYFAFSLSSSVYFCSIDILLIVFLHIMLELTRIKLNLFQEITLRTNIIYAVFDCIVLLVNPFKEIAIHYSKSSKFFVHWEYEPGILYNMHLIFCYLLVLEIITTLIIKMVRTPGFYRKRYSLIIEGIVIIVVLNCFFLYAPVLSFFQYDISVLLYSSVCFLIYYNSMYYSEMQILREAPRDIIKNLKSPVIIFDYEKAFIMKNSAEVPFLPENIHEYSMDDFIKLLDISDKITSDTDKKVFYWVYENQVYQCDYQVIKRSNNTIGYVFIFTEASVDYDLLTGFYTEMNAVRYYEKEKLELPIGIYICDINRLSSINEHYGRRSGDRAIRTVASLMKEHGSENDYYVRLHDALLMRVAPGTSLSQMKDYQKKMQEIITEVSVGSEKSDDSEISGGSEKLQLQSAIAMCDYSQSDIYKAISSAKKSIRMRKMLDADSAHSSLLFSLARVLQETDPGTEQHVMRTRVLGEKLAERIGLSDEETANLALLCLLHDIGKLCIPLEILNKPGKLSKAEWELMKTHTEKGYRIAKASRELSPLADMILHHHEFWNGKGYPSGLAKEEIPKLSRIISIIDAYDAMGNDRPYHKAISVDEALVELERCAGTQFDPYLVSEFVQMIKESSVYRLNHRMTAKRNNAENEQASSKISEESLKIVTEDISEEVSDESDSNLAPIRFSKYILSLPDQVIVSADDNFEYLTGYSQADIESGSLRQNLLIFPEDKERYNKLKEDLLNKYGEAFIEHRLMMKDGNCRYVSCHGWKFYDSAVKEQRIQVVIMDITESIAVKNMIATEKENSVRNMEMLKKQISHDALTGALTRDVYRADTQEALIRNNKIVAMIMCDIDSFKAYNDTFGHVEGDELLKGFAKSLLQSTEKNGMVCRMGGDEFSITLLYDMDISRENITSHISSIWKNVNDSISQYDSRVSISMGAVLSHGNEKNFARMYEEADEALYRAKAMGKKRLLVSEK